MTLAFAFLISTALPAAVNVDEILARTRTVYAPVAAAAGGRFVLEIRENPSLSSASADRLANGDFLVRIESGLLASPKLNDDVLTLILCHELGHLFGGSPRRPVPDGWEGPVDPSGLSLLSAEGQADFYAGSVCFRRLAAPRTAASSVPPRVRTICETGWGGLADDAALCERAAIAGEIFLKLNFNFPISFETPDPQRVDRTLIGEYPSRQCRLDTLLSAAAVAEPRPLDLGGAPPAAREHRLPCWFKP